MVLTVHHLGHSQSDRIVWLCEELGIDYELKKYDRGPIFSPPEYLALHPIGAAPVITDGDITLAESGACMEYIINVHGGGRLTLKPGDKHYADYLYWLHFANGTLQPALGRVMTLLSAGVEADNPRAKMVNDRQGRALGFLNERLGKVKWLAGDEFTAADVMGCFSLTGMREFYPYDLSPYPNIVAYLGRVYEREGYRQAMQKGDPDIDVKTLIGASPPPRLKAIQEMMRAQSKS